MIYAVIDTNVIVSALLSGNPDSPTKRCLRAVLSGRVCPLYNDKIVAEYRDVLTRSKFHFGNERVEVIINKIIYDGLNTEQIPSGENFPDPTDRVFYEVALAKSDEGAKIVTGNTRHYPISPIVVTPAEFCDMIGL